MTPIQKWLSNNLYWFKKSTRKLRRYCRKNAGAAELLEANRHFKNCATNETCFILGNGPSLRDVDLRLLKDEDVITVNQASRHPDFKLLRPRFHFWADPQFFSVNPGEKAEDTEFLNVMRSINSESHKPACFFPIEQRAFVEQHHLHEDLDVHYFFSRIPFFPEFEREIDFAADTPRFHGVVMWAIIMAVYAGYKRICLLGCDTTSIIVNLKSILQQNDNEDYGYDVSPNEKERLERMIRRQGIQAQAEAFLQTLREYGWLYQYCKRRDISLINCSSATIIDSIPRQNLETVLQQIHKHE